MNYRYPGSGVHSWRGLRPMIRVFAPAFALGLLVLVLGGPASPAVAQSGKGAPRALVLAVQGEAQAHGPAAKATRALKADTTLPAGVEIRTGRRSSVTLQLSRTLMCRIGPNTVVSLEKLKGGARLQLSRGDVGARVQPNSGTKLQVVTPTAIASVRGTEFIVESSPAPGEDEDAASESRVLVNEGVVAVATADDETASRDVEAGNKIVSDGETLKLSILERFEQDKFSIFEEFKSLKKKNYEAYVEQLRRNEELKEQMERMKEMR